MLIKVICEQKKRIMIPCIILYIFFYATVEREKFKVTVNPWDRNMVNNKPFHFFLLQWPYIFLKCFEQGTIHSFISLCVVSIMWPWYPWALMTSLFNLNFDFRAAILFYFNLAFWIVDIWNWNKCAAGTKSLISKTLYMEQLNVSFQRLRVFCLPYW